MIKILLIEDIADYLLIQRNALQRSNFEVLAAQSAPEAIRIARRERPQLVVLDLEMAERTGGGLLDLVRNEPSLQNIPVLLVSSRSEAEETARQHAFVGVVRKPVQPAQLIDAISRALNLARRMEVKVLVVAAPEGGGAKEKRIGRSVDLSESGVLAEFPRPLAVGTRVHLRFFLPGQPEGVGAPAEVTRCASRSADAHDIGFRFGELPPEDAQRLKGFLVQGSEARPDRLALLKG